MKRLLDASGAVVKTFHHDDTTGISTIQTTYDPTANLEDNKVRADSYSKSDWIRPVASIPVPLLEQWCQEDGLKVVDVLRNTKNYQTWMRTKLYDIDYQALLTSPHSRKSKVAAKFLAPQYVDANK